MVALKVVRRIGPSQWKRIVLEREALVQCDHPNVVTLLDYGQIPDGCFFATRWMEQSLSEYMVKNPVVDLHQAMEWMLQVADAVQYVHKLGIVHRDLKPSNILLNASGKSRLTDFGIAKQLLNPEDVTTTTTPIGTPGYMAPEQTGKIETTVSFTTDVYGLGAVMYCLLTSRPPFMGANSIQVLDQVVSTAPIAPRRLRADVPQDLERIFLKCLEKYPSDRYPSAKALIEDLMRYSQGLPVLARPVPAPVRWWRIARSQPVITGLIALVGLSILAMLTGYYSLNEQSRKNQSEAEVRSLLQAIASSSPERLSALLDQATGVELRTIQRQISELSVSNKTPIDAVTQLRWICIAPDVAIAPQVNTADQVQDMLKTLSQISAQELSIVMDRLQNHPQYQSAEFKRSLFQSVASPQFDDRFLVAVCFLKKLDKSWVPNSEQGLRIAEELLSISAVDVVHWSKALQPISESLLTVLDRERSQKDIRYLWDSPNVQNIAWQWCLTDAANVVHYIRNAPKPGLKGISQLSEEIRNETLRILRLEYDSQRRKYEHSVRPEDSTPMISELVDHFEGIMAREGGVLKSVPRDRIPEVIEKLASEGWAISSLQGRDEAQGILFSVAVEKSMDTYIVEFDIPVIDMATRMLEQRAAGFEATHLCTLPTDLNRLTVLWRKGEWLPSRFLQTVEEGDRLREQLASSDLIDEPHVDTKSLIHYYNEPDEIAVTDKVYALVAARKLANDTKGRRRFSDLRYSREQDLIHSMSLLFVESSLGGSGMAKLEDSTKVHDKKAEWLLSMGGTPFYFERDLDKDICVSYWRLRSDSMESSRIDELASFAIGAWILGDPTLSLDSMNMDRCAELRTQVSEWIGRLELDAPPFLHALSLASTPNQRYGLLMALGNWRTDQFQAHQNEFQSVLRMLWEDGDSGVHFAADHVMRIAFPEQSNRLIDIDLCEKYGLSNRGADRDWYYGPFGLPFIIITERELQMIGGDERLIWFQAKHRDVVSLERTLAVCAIETPEWLMAKHLAEIRETVVDNVPKMASDSGPARGYRLENMLRFCRWLDEKDRVSRSSIVFPEYPKLKPTPFIPEEAWDFDGYRLPSGTEWEIVARAGTWGGSFLGDSLEFLNEYAWTCENTFSVPGDGGRKKPSKNGLFDILGSVYETVLPATEVAWQRDGYGYSAGSKVWRIDDTKFHSLRGGSFLSHRFYCSSGAEHGIRVGIDINAGFRIVRTLNPRAENNSSK